MYSMRSLSGQRRVHPSTIQEPQPQITGGPVKLKIPGPGPAELGVGIAQETGFLGNLDAYSCWPHYPQKPMDGDRGNLRISKIQEKFVSGLRMGYSCYKVPHPGWWGPSWWRM